MGYTKKILKKGFISLLMFLFVMASVLPAGPHAVANEPDYYEYVDNGDGTATITGYTGPEGVDIVIPSELGGLEVTTIADGVNLLTGVFSHKNLTAVDIPDSITIIGEHAFNDNRLTEVTIPDSVTSIGRSAFHNNNLKSIIIPESVTNMGIAIFRGNQHTSSLFTIYGFTDSVAETYANDRNHTFRPLDTSPSVHIRYAGETVADELQVDLQSSGELEAVYSHSTDVVEIDDVLWEVDGTMAGTGDTLQLDSYTDTIGERTVTLTVETNYGVTATAEITLDVILPVPDQPELQVDSRTDTSISLTWGSVPYADEYILVRDDEEVYRGTSTSYVDTGLAPDTVYGYSLVAVNASGTSESVEVTARTVLPEPSTLDITLTHADGSSYPPGAWTNQSVTAAVYASNDDGVPVDTLYYSLSNGADWQEYTDPLEFTAEGVHVLFVSAQDDAGNTVETERTIRIDQTPPSVNFGTNGNESWFTFAETTVTVTDSDGPFDANSGVDDASLRYVWTPDSSHPADGEADWTPFTNGGDLEKKDADGDWYLHIQAADAAGNEVRVTTNRFRLNTSDARLSDLTLSEGELHPAFDAEIFEYTVTVPNRVSEITLTPVAADDGSTVMVRVHEKSAQPVPNGQESEPLPLHVGDNTMVVEVTALNGTERKYTIHIVREARSSSGGEGGGSWPANSRFVGINGAVISFNGGEIEIPADAWPRSFRLTIDTRDREQATDTLPLTGEARFVSKIVTLTKDQGGSFQEAITLSLELDFESFGEDLNRVLEAWTISLYWLDEEANEWVELDNIVVDGEKGTVSGTIDHFTNFAAIARPVEAADEPDHEELLEPRDPADDGPQMTFSDLDGHWAEEAIYDLVARGTIQGYPDGTFQPNQTMTRAEFVTMAVQALNLEGKGVMESMDRAHSTVFTDSEGHWAQEAIAVAVVHGIVSGYDEFTFGVNDPITREQLASIVMRAMGLKTETGESVNFTDQQEISAWALEAVAVLHAEGVLTGYPDGSFRPQQEVTRAEAAIVVSKVLELL